MIRKYRNHRRQSNPQDREVEPQNTKSHKTSIERYEHYTDLIRSGNMIKSSLLHYVHGYCRDLSSFQQILHHKRFKTSGVEGIP